MNKSWIPILLLLLTFLIPSGDIDLNANETEIKIDRAKSEGYVAFIVNTADVKDIDIDTPVDKCECNGTGVMVHGDGHKTPCQCYTLGTNEVCKCNPIQTTIENKVCGCDSSDVEVECKCKTHVYEVKIDQPVVIEKDNIKILYFSAAWCGPCQTFKSRELPKLAGMKINNSIYGDDVETEIEIVDVDKMPSIYAKYRNNRKYIPLFVFVDNDGVEQGYLMGYQTADKISSKYNELK